MLKNSLQQINYIIDNLDFEGTDRLVVKGGKMKYQFTHPSGPESSDLLKGLSNVIYSEFYCSGEFAESKEPTYTERLAYVKKLREANATVDQLHQGWTVDSVLSNGKVYASKGNHSRQVFPGDYVRQSPSESLSKGSTIHIYQNAEHDNAEDVFFYIFGATLTEAATPGLVRFYFNAQPEGGIALVKNISSIFNHYQIPFQFKCLNQPAYYNRTDSAVLYLSKNYADLAWELIQSFYAELQPLLNDEIPFFTKQMAPGIGFAENPLQEKESFGQSRSRLIAEAIVHAHDNQLPKAEWLPLILKRIQSTGLDAQQFHLNPNSHYPYQLSQIA